MTMIRCPVCGSSDCIKDASAVLEQAASMYQPCEACAADLPLDKTLPLRDLGVPAGSDVGRCRRCGRRHIDIVMAQVLGILIEDGLKKSDAVLKDVGTPLIVYGLELREPPRLGRKELILLLDDADQAAAERIIGTVPEVRGVIRRRGGPGKSVGLLDTGYQPHVYELLAGCDVRADIVSSLPGEMVFYRRQSLTHLEFFRNNSTKIGLLEKMFLDGDLAGKVVVDGLASVGTLGLLAASGGARKVILNDAWQPAVESMLWNLEANQELLGVQIEQLQIDESLPLIGTDPIQVAHAWGSVELEIWHGDLRRLPEKAGPCDICIIDTFPGMPVDDFVRRWRPVTRDKIITL